MRYRTSVRVLAWVLSPMPWMLGLGLFAFLPSPTKRPDPMQTWMFWTWLLCAHWIAGWCHEGGHALAGRFYGVKLRAFAVWPIRFWYEDGRWRRGWKLHDVFSDQVTFDGAPESLRAQLSILAAGPLANAVVYVAVWIVARATSVAWPEATLPLMIIGVMNMVSFWFSLSPHGGTPPFSDGDQMVAAVVWTRRQQTE